MSDNLIYNVKRVCKSCKATFQSSVLDNEIYCSNCRDIEDDTLDVYTSSREWDDIVNTSCRTSPVFYD